MTATPSNPSQQRANVLRKAGTLFGLDLSGLFEDEDGESSVDFGGLMPSFQTTTYLKGRSPSTLTYKTPKTPARETTFSLTAPSEALTPATQAQPAATGGGGTSYTPPPTPTQRNYNVDVSSGLSSQLFGHEDYYKNLEAGVPQQFLQDWVSQNVGLLGEGNKPGQGGLYDQIMSGRVARTSGLNPPSYAGSTAPVSTGSGLSAEKFGHADYFANLAAGKTPEQLKQYVQQNVGQLAGGNVPGGGGLYDQIMSGSVNINQVNPTPAAAPAPAPAPAPVRLNAAIAAAGNRVSNKEARQIARDTGRSVQQVKNRAERQGKR